MRRVLDVATERTGIDFAGVPRGHGRRGDQGATGEDQPEELSRQLRKETEESQGAKLRAIKRLEVARAFLRSKSRPEWMILEVVSGHPAGAAPHRSAGWWPLRYFGPE